MLSYQDIEIALKRVPLERLPQVYEFILAQVEAEDERLWDDTFALPESQALFDHMAAQVRAELVNGQTFDLNDVLDDAEATPPTTTKA